MSRPAFSTALRRRGLPVVAVTAYGIAALAWIALAGRLFPMPGAGAGGVAMDPTAPGAVEAMATANGPGGVARYLVVWGVMMVAMMYPSSAGAFQWYADRDRGDPRPDGRDRRASRRERWTGTVRNRAGVAVAFAGSYTLVWVLVGIVPLAVDAAVSISSLAERWGALYFGVAALAVGAFQLSPVKRRCLARCRYPAGTLADGPESGAPDAWPGLADAARSGWAFGRQDVGSCGVPMGLMVVVGSMNLVWMALITLALSLERLTTNGQHWATATGVLALAVGAGLVVAWGL